MTYDVTLHSGPRLLRIHGGGASPLHPQDVTARAVEFLFDRLELGPDLRLSDVVGLFVHCPDLHAIYRRQHSQDVCAGAALGPMPNDDNGDLLFLELRQTWFYNTHRNEYPEVRDFHMVGVGHRPGIHTGPAPDPDGLEHYSLLGTPLRTVLALPIRLDMQVPVYEADPFAVSHNRRIATVRNGNLNLGELLQVILRELTAFGPSETSEAVVNDMARQLGNSVDWAPFTAEEIWEKYCSKGYQQACQATFESTGALSPLALEQAIARIPDRIKARRWLGKTLGKAVRLRPSFRDLDGRGLRQAIAQHTPPCNAQTR